MKSKMRSQTNELVQAIGELAEAQQQLARQIDIVKYRNKQEPFAIINNWMRGRGTIEFLGLLDKLSNPDLNLSNSRGLKTLTTSNTRALGDGK